MIGVLGIDGEIQVSESLYRRKNPFRETGFLGFPRQFLDSKKKGICDGAVMNRWSDCGCESCVSWINCRDHKLHVEVRETSSQGRIEENCKEKPTENVIFIHGFLSSSSFWTESVLQHLSEFKKGKYKLFSVDLLGFGRSPKPRECFYTLRDHVEMIEKSVILPFNINHFHLVAHSMGCIIALALAAKYPKYVRSLTLVSPPIFPSSKDGASLAALEKLAEKKLWPPLAFGSSVMSWYEHIGRCICFLVCRNHRTWERILKLLTPNRHLHFMIMDLTRHTHHSAWHSMHNVICGGAKFTDGYLAMLIKYGVKICVVQGDEDPVVPSECWNYIKKKYPDVEVNMVAKADHTSVVFGREKDLIQNLDKLWIKSAADTTRT